MGEKEISYLRAMRKGGLFLSHTVYWDSSGKNFELRLEQVGEKTFSYWIGRPSQSQFFALPPSVREKRERLPVKVTLGLGGRKRISDFQ